MIVKNNFIRNKPKIHSYSSLFITPTMMYGSHLDAIHFLKYFLQYFMPSFLDPLSSYSLRPVLMVEGGHSLLSSVFLQAHFLAVCLSNLQSCNGGFSCRIKAFTVLISVISRKVDTAYLVISGEHRF